MSSPSPRIIILYGSQTGISKQYAQQVYRLLFRLHLTENALLCHMDHFLQNHAQELFQNNEEIYGIFVCSTTGQGDQPTNMQAFWKYLLLKKHGNHTLSNLHFSVFGLGDSAYQKFNFVAKKLRRRLIQLGGKEFYEHGFGDDQHPHGVEGTFPKWQMGLREALLQRFPLQKRGVKDEISEDQVHPPQYEIVSNQEDDSNTQFMSDSQNSPLTDHSSQLPQQGATYETSVQATLSHTERLTPQDHWQDVRHMTFDISQSPNLRYNPGDVMAIHMENPQSTVDALIERLDIPNGGNDPISIRKLDSNAPSIPFHKNVLTWREIFTHYLDVCGTPSRYFFELLSHFTKDEREKERLQYLCSGEGTDDFFRYNDREKRSYLEALDDFPNAKPPHSYILDMITPLQPRYFSIASAQALHPNEIHIVVAIIKFKTPFERIRYGNCTSWMRDLKVGSRVPIWITKGTMLMAPVERPMIMIGPGTGVAPFRSFIQYRFALHQQDKSRKIGDTALFFGNRSRNKDFLYEHDWENMRNVEEFPFQLMTAFSRDQPQKIYVQHRMLEHASLIWNWITFEGAVFYVAGNSANMPEGVRNIMLQIARKQGGKSPEEAEEWVRRLERSKRYQQETW